MSTAVTAQPKKARSAPKRVSVAKIQKFSSRLGIQGWADLDPVLLASLALEAPLLLIGSHGTAKTLVAEKVAKALNLELRHYNASLLNYDDLVGIPVPDEQGGLEYLGAAGAIWQAEFVFFDEINRCRIDLQNKLFPLVHEKRIAGEELTHLRHRWAAINPPGSFEAKNNYLGVEELDDALVDRFWFIVPVPGWGQLKRKDRLALVRSGAKEPAVSRGQLPLEQLVAQTAALAATNDGELGDRLADYIVTLVDELKRSEVALSPRRSRLLLPAICAVHAARVVLGTTRAELAKSAEIALLHALPGRATSSPPSLATIVAAHRQAWDATELAHGDLKRDLLEQPDALNRVRIAYQRDADDALLAQLITQVFASKELIADRNALAVIFSRTLAERPLTAAAWGYISQYANPILTPAEHKHALRPGPELDAIREIEGWIKLELPDLDPADETHKYAQLVTALLRGVTPDDLVAAGSWRKLRDRFLLWCVEFEVQP
ncbi:MAG: MoxR family ATPase [Microthrixaceae bacterium]